MKRPELQNGFLEEIHYVKTAEAYMDHLEAERDKLAKRVENLEHALGEVRNRRVTPTECVLIIDAALQEATDE